MIPSSVIAALHARRAFSWLRPEFQLIALAYLRAARNTRGSQ
jgi:hypothetical protein